ncbi:acyltransferase [Bacillus thuringiensis]|nr:acyltransferase [Bacillus thuringiensis]
MESRRRTISYDVLKAFAIFLVCFYHFNHLGLGFIPGEKYYPSIIYIFFGLASMGVPLFFMVNGALLLNKPFNFINHIQKSIRLYFIVVIWKFITVTILIWKNQLTDYTWVNFANLLFSNSFPNVDLAVYWFMNALISIYLIFPIIKEIFDRSNLLTYYLTGIIFFFATGLDTLGYLLKVIQWFTGTESLALADLKSMNPFGNYAYALFYFLLGGILGKWLSQSKNVPSTWVSILVFSIGWILLTLWGTYNTNNNNQLFDTVFNGYPTIMTVTMSLGIFVLFYRLNVELKFLRETVIFISRNTLSVYFLHWIVGYILSEYYFKLFVNHLELAVFAVFTHSLFLLSTSLVLSSIIQRIPLLNKLVKM